MEEVLFCQVIEGDVIKNITFPQAKGKNRAGFILSRSLDRLKALRSSNISFWALDQVRLTSPDKLT